MSDKPFDEPLLARWSRRKREVAKEQATDAPRAVPEAAKAPVASASADSQKQIAEPEAAFDPASLPPIDSIVSATDIRAFLAKGVPAELRRAALRRVWVADPAIRDFVGLAENDWDFTKPESIPGFGALAPEFDVQAMVRGVFGDAPEVPHDQVAAAETTSERPVEAEPPKIELVAQSEGKPEAVDAAQSEDERQAPEPSVQRNTPAASQTEITLSNHKNRRQHGGALPQEFPVTKRGL